MTTFYYLSTKTDFDLGSELLWRIARPKILADAAGDLTRKYFSSQKHPEREEYFVAITDTQTQYVNPDTVTNLQNPVSEQTALLEAYYPSAEVAAVKQTIIDAGGTRFNVQNIVPGRWVTTTREDLEADGWFDEPELA
jgi:hypothetical protein